MGTIPGNSTIDATNDNNGLNTLRKYNPQSGTHGNIAGCANNLKGADNLKAIVGHGDKGIVVTGSGQTASDPNKYISLWNQSYWEPHLKQIKNCTTLYFYACHPGASQTGADFLYNVARVINARALGPTGFIYVSSTGGITLEPGSTWQSATPTVKPNPIEPPSAYIMEIEPMQEVMLKIDAGYKSVPIASVATAVLQQFHTAGQRLLLGSARSHSTTLSGDDATALLRFIAFDRPFTPPGSPLAMITAELELMFDDGTSRKFAILNNRIVHDTQFEDVYYYCQPGIEELLR
jgi:hypothetical protein